MAVIKNFTLLINQYNYGQRLQSYALNAYIKKYLNYDVDIINYNKERKTFHDFKKFEDEYFKFSNIDDITKDDIILYGGDQIFNFSWKWYLDIFDGSRFPNNKK